MILPTLREAFTASLFFRIFYGFYTEGGACNYALFKKKNIKKVS